MEATTRPDDLDTMALSKAAFPGSNHHHSDESIKDIYRGLPLDEGGSNVRVLDILPGEPSTAIECRLSVRQLSADTGFEALSYTWGKNIRDGKVRVNGVGFAITVNLESALRYIRRISKKRRLWADDLYIDQSDLEECGHQVKNMGQIYRNADQVLIWLGPGSECSDTAMRYLLSWLKVPVKSFQSAANTCCPNHFSVFEMRISNYPALFQGLLCPKCNRKCFCADCCHLRREIETGLEDLLHRSWWQRIWVVQKVAMAAGDPLVGCGQFWVPWSGLVRFAREGQIWPASRAWIAMLHEIRMDVKSPPRLRDSAGLIPWNSSGAPADDVFEWLRQTTRFGASDPRDKIYALLGMARSRRWREMKPDHTLSIRDLILHLVAEMILADSQLDVLMLGNAYLGHNVWLPEGDASLSFLPLPS